MLEYNCCWFTDGIGWYIKMNLIGFILLVAYAGGIWKFLSGYHRTNFSPSLPEKVALALLWPVLLASNKSYRRNFRKALKGRG